MAWSLEQILRGARSHHASDVHLVRGVAPVYRINGEIRPIDGPPLTADMLRTIIDGTLSDKQRAQLEETWQLCFSQFWEDIGRFRASIYMHAGVPEMAIRICEPRVREREELGLPAVVEELTRRTNG